MKSAVFTLALFLVALLGFGLAQQNTPPALQDSAPRDTRAYDVFIFGMDRRMMDIFSLMGGYRKPEFSISEGCSEPPPRCSVHKDELSLSFTFDSSWKNMYQLNLSSSQANLVEALVMRFGEPEETEYKTEHYVISGDPRFTATCTTSEYGNTVSVTCGSRMASSRISTRSRTIYVWLINGIRYEAACKYELSGKCIWTEATITHLELEEQVRQSAQHALEQEQLRREQEREGATKKASEGF